MAAAGEQLRVLRPGIAAGFSLAAEMSDADARCRLAALATTLAELAGTLGDLAQVVSGRAAER